jgi:hypothetical protein
LDFARGSSDPLTSLPALRELGVCGDFGIGGLGCVGEVVNSMIKLAIGVGSLALSVATTVNAYGLTIKSWPWLIFGSIGAMLLLGILQSDDK